MRRGGQSLRPPWMLWPSVGARVMGAPRSPPECGQRCASRCNDETHDFCDCIIIIYSHSINTDRVAVCGVTASFEVRKNTQFNYHEPTTHGLPATSRGISAVCASTVSAQLLSTACARRGSPASHTSPVKQRHRLGGPGRWRPTVSVEAYHSLLRSTGGTDLRLSEQEAFKHALYRHSRYRRVNPSRRSYLRQPSSTRILHVSILCASPPHVAQSHFTDDRAHGPTRVACARKLASMSSASMPLWSGKSIGIFWGSSSRKPPGRRCG